MTPDHPHPCNFRLRRSFDRGWGEAAFEYQWDSTSGVKAAEDAQNPDLTLCYLYEWTTYAQNEGRWEGGYFYPSDPPFVGWRFRDPTDGRTAPVGLECFPASQGWAWDRHKLGGMLVLPDAPGLFTVQAVQEYRFKCEVCGYDAIVPGPDSGPHTIIRSFEVAGGGLWRYALAKHGRRFWMDLDEQGYRDDSAHIGFGPWSC